MRLKFFLKNECNIVINCCKRGRNIFRKDKYKVLSDLNSGSLNSETDYFIYVDLEHFMTYIYKRKNRKWNIEKSYLCTIGKPSTPTIKGDYKVKLKGDYFGEKQGYKCLYYTQIEKNYLFHSIIYNLNGTVRDGRLGMALSDGCIRLATANAKWLWNNVPKDSSILIQ